MIDLMTEIFGIPKNIEDIKTALQIWKSYDTKLATKEKKFPSEKSFCNDKRLFLANEFMNDLWTPFNEPIITQYYVFKDDLKKFMKDNDISLSEVRKMFENANRYKKASNIVDKSVDNKPDFKDKENNEKLSKKHFHLDTNSDSILNDVEINKSWRWLCDFEPDEGNTSFYKFLFAIVLLYGIIDSNDGNKRINLSMCAKNKLNQLFPEELRENIFEDICSTFASFDNESDNDEVDVDKYTYEFSEFFYKINEKNQLSESDYKTTLLVFKMCILLITAKSKENIVRKDELCNEFRFAVISEFYDDCLEEARSNYSIEKYNCAIELTKFVLFSDSPKQRADAFNTLGLCAIESKQYQLAYDVYFAWIFQKVTPELLLGLSENEINKLNEMLNEDRENKWRERNASKVAIMYCNFAYVCSTIYDFVNDERVYKTLNEISLKSINKAISLDSVNQAYYCTQGTIFTDKNKERDALDSYKKCYDYAKSTDEKLTAIRCLLELSIKINFCEKQNDEANYVTNNKLIKLSDKFIYHFEQVIKRNKYNEDIELGGELYRFVKKCRSFSEKYKSDEDIFKLEALLYHLYYIAGLISCELKQDSFTVENPSLHLDLIPQGFLEDFGQFPLNEEKLNKEKSEKNPIISYYVPLENIKYLFETEDSDNENGPNYLTMMHLRYMNDPDEGLVLLQRLEHIFPKTAEELKYDFLDKQFVFLKSFTNLEDNMHMWTMYAKTEENDCDGFCVCIAPETFDWAVNNKSQNTDKNNPVTLDKSCTDDYNLYNVCYISSDGKMYVDEKENEYLSQRYNELQNVLKSIMDLAEEMEKKTGCNICDEITEISLQALSKILVLFKDYSYRLEGERRLVITRGLDNGEIKRTKNNPPKLFINPKFQVYPEKIIIGSKVKNADFWIPYLQQELDIIKRKWPRDVRELHPVVRKSQIHIR